LREPFSGKKMLQEEGEGVVSYLGGGKRKTIAGRGRIFL